MGFDSPQPLALVLCKRFSWVGRVKASDELWQLILPIPLLTYTKAPILPEEWGLWLLWIARLRGELAWIIHELCTGQWELC